ncbi:MAG: hypothetical protein BGO63_15835 [Candidatus Accumulibacter sp. 66-26]|nr:MAG: hypothetical protein BGO63_15835 [Candidatus Accumulibacter sp. 66-26]
MLQEAQLLTWIVSSGLLVLVAMGVHYHLRFLAHLRTAFPSVWRQLGSPTIVNPEGSFAENSLFFFVFFGRFSRLNDPVLFAIGRALQVVFFLCLACVLALFFLLRLG